MMTKHRKHNIPKRMSQAARTKQMLAQAVQMGGEAYLGKYLDVFTSQLIYRDQGFIEAALNLAKLFGRIEQLTINRKGMVTDVFEFQLAELGKQLAAEGRSLKSVVIKSQVPDNDYLTASIMDMVSRVQDCIDAALIGDITPLLNFSEYDQLNRIFIDYLSSERVKDKYGGNSKMQPHTSLIYEMIRAMLPIEAQQPKHHFPPYGKRVMEQLKRRAEDESRSMTKAEEEAYQWLKSRDDVTLQSDIRRLLQRGDEHGGIS